MFREKLRSYLELMDEVNREADQAEFWKIKAEGTSAINLSFGSKSTKAKGMPDFVVKYLSLHEHCAELGRKAEDAKEEIIAIINTLENPDHRRVLKYLFIDGKTIREIAKTMGYNDKSVYRIKNKCINDLEKAYM